MAVKADVRLPPDNNKGPMLLGITWTMAAMATTIVILRIYSRTVLQNSMGWDDFAIIAASVGIQPFSHHFRSFLIRPVLALNISRTSVSLASGS